MLSVQVDALGAIVVFGMAAALVFKVSLNQIRAQAREPERPRRQTAELMVEGHRLPSTSEVSQLVTDRLWALLYSTFIWVC